MSLFSRLFRKAPSRSPAAAPATQPASPSKADKAQSRPNAAERALAVMADEKALRVAVEARDIQAVARLVVAGVSTQVRQAAADAIDDPDVLRQLIRDVRGGNDKNVYKVLTGKRDALVEQTRRLEKLRAEIDVAASDLERHSQRPYDPLSGARLAQVEHRWNAVAAQADPEVRARAQQWIDRSHQTIVDHEREVAAEAARVQAAADAAAEAQRLREEQAQASALAAAEQARVVAEQTREVSEQQQAEQRTLREIGELIRKARAALGGGSTSRAAGMRRSIDEKLAVGPVLPPGLASQLQLLDKQLDELKDWKNFSVAPKRAELIDEMEALIGATYEPLDLADRIKHLKDEWRTLGKGAGENLEADLQRFEQAVEKAYQPCAEYFAAQALVREENLRRRDALLAQLKEFEAGHDWERADWRVVIGTLRETKQQWRGVAPIDPQAGKRQQEEFSAVTAGMQARVDAEYARNVKEKEALIERARQLLASDDARKAIEAIKDLQRRWQSVGLVPREVDQRLWSEFRQHCDAVFQKRQQESAAYSAGLENNKAQAVALCEQLEGIAALEGAELLARAGAIGELRTAFEALGEFPRADTRELRNRLERGLDRCKQSIVRQHARDAERGWDDLFEAADLVRAYRLAVARNEKAQHVDSLKAAAESFIASERRWPKRGLEALKARLAREGATDLAANEVALRTLCVRAEILTETPTPSEDQPLRRDHQ
ncbi:MAG: hypothetical protein K0Q76_4230, partial [Panacagrimonas sp.]